MKKIKEQKQKKLNRKIRNRATKLRGIEQEDEKIKKQK